jgi:serine kinase of HPr protein (carbohydrate metabolism regulator)
VNRPAVHANCLILGTCGLLIRGDAGSGKSSLCDILIEAARAKGNLGQLVADDYVFVSAEHSRLLARVPEAISGRMEIRGFGLVDTACVPEAHVGLIVDLVPVDRVERLPEAPLGQGLLDGVQVPVLHCPMNMPDISLRLVRWALRRLLPDAPDYI